MEYTGEPPASPEDEVSTAEVVDMAYDEGYDEGFHDGTAAKVENPEAFFFDSYFDGYAEGFKAGFITRGEM